MADPLPEDISIIHKTVSPTPNNQLTNCNSNVSMSATLTSPGSTHSSIIDNHEISPNPNLNLNTSSYSFSNTPTPSNNHSLVNSINLSSPNNANGTLNLNLVAQESVDSASVSFSPNQLIESNTRIPLQSIISSAHHQQFSHELNQSTHSLTQTSKILMRQELLEAVDRNTNLSNLIEDNKSNSEKSLKIEKSAISMSDLTTSSNSDPNIHNLLLTDTTPKQLASNNNSTHSTASYNFSSRNATLTRQPTLAELQAKDEKIANLQIQVQTLTALVDLDGKSSQSSSKTQINTLGHGRDNLSMLGQHVGFRRGSEIVKGRIL